jgi:hypothetical protein
MLTKLIFLSFLSLSACLAPVAEPNADAVDETHSPEVALTAAELSSGLCCIDYTCPSNPEIETTGCKAGGLGPGTAFRTCFQKCGEPCDSSGWICE